VADVCNGEPEGRPPLEAEGQASPEDTMKAGAAGR
jgi:hypothetical protein